MSIREIKKKIKEKIEKFSCSREIDGNICHVFGCVLKKNIEQKHKVML